MARASFAGVCHDAYLNGRFGQRNGDSRRGERAGNHRQNVMFAEHKIRQNVMFAEHKIRTNVMFAEHKIRQMSCLLSTRLDKMSCLLHAISQNGTITTAESVFTHAW